MISSTMDIEEFDSEKFIKKLAAHIAKVRKSSGYSQDRVCLEAGLARGTLSKIENGKVEPKISTLALIAITIGVPLSKLTNVDLK
jgi:transcriptional regulator with XRE-family HTH domain